MTMDEWTQDVLDKCTDFDILTYGKNLLLKELVRGNSVLDVGCGAGVLLEELEKKGKKVTGIDISEKAINAAKKRLKNTKFYNKPLKKLKLKTKFETVVCSEVLEHVEDDKEFLRLLGDFVKENGELIITVPAHKWLYGPHDKYLGHYRRYSKDELRKKIEDSGFKIKKLRYWNQISFLPSFYYSRIAKKRPPYKDTMTKILSNSFAKKFLDLILKIDVVISRPFGITLVAVCSKSQQ